MLTWQSHLTMTPKGGQQRQSTRVQLIFPQNRIDRGKALSRTEPQPSHSSWPWLRASDVQDGQSRSQLLDYCPTKVKEGPLSPEANRSDAL